MCIAITCLPCCNVVNFEIKLVFLIKPFLYMTRKSRQKLRYLENEKSFQGEIKSNFHHFQTDLSCQKLFQTIECSFKLFLVAFISLIRFNYFLYILRQGFNSLGFLKFFLRSESNGYKEVRQTVTRIKEVVKL